MSECVVRMEMPKRCYECDMADGITCMATGVVYGREVPKMTWIRRRPDWCPIVCQLPEGHGRLVDADAVEIIIRKWFEEIKLNPDILLDGVKSLPTIVPAEAERSETWAN